MLKNYRLLTIVILFVALQLTAVVPVFAATTEGTTGQCSWAFDGDTGVLTISAGTEGGQMADYEAEAPWVSETPTKVVVKDGVTKIGDYAFWNCDKVKAVYIPSTVTSIGTKALDFVHFGLSDVNVYCEIFNPSALTWATPGDDLDAATLFHVPSGTKTAWEEAFSSTARCQFVDDVYSADQPFEVGSVADWELLCSYVKGGATAICAKLTADITLVHGKYIPARESNEYNSLLGDAVHPYQGTFDGNGKKMILEYVMLDMSVEGNYTRAPFLCIKGATIKNLLVDGWHADYQFLMGMSGNNYRGPDDCAGLVGNVIGGDNYIQNCLLSYDFMYAGQHNGGVVSTVYPGATLTISDVLYEGAFKWGDGPTSVIDGQPGTTTPKNNAVFVAANSGTVQLTNCLISGTMQNVKNSDGSSAGSSYPNYLWTLNESGTSTLTNCYYKSADDYINHASAIDASALTVQQIDDVIGPLWKVDGDSNVPVWLFPMEGEGTTASPYLVNDADDWARFIYYTTVQEAAYQGKCWRQTADIATTKWGAQLLGTDDSQAQYDGNGKTLTVSVESEKNHCAPFLLVKHGAISALTVGGTLKGRLHAAGLVSKVMGSGQSNISNCRVSTAVTFGGGSPHGGGVVGHAHSSTLTVDGCLFDGTLTPASASGSNAGAIVGWADNIANVRVTNCVEQGTLSADIEKKGMNLYIDNYSIVQTFGGNTTFSFSELDGGRKPYQITWDATELAVDMGRGATLTEHPVSQIKTYNNEEGLFYNDAYLVSWGQDVLFTATLADGGYCNGVIANGKVVMPDVSDIFTISDVKEDYELTLILRLVENVDNTELLAANEGKKRCVQLADREFEHNGTWHTLCVPFSMTAEQVAADLGSPVALKTLSSSSFSDGTLTLTFTDATTIEAGKPYIVKWGDEGYMSVNPLFESVTVNPVSPADAKVSTAVVDFVGTYAPVAFTAADRSVLYMGEGNKLYYPNGAMTINGFRAYFKLNGISAGDVTNAVELVFDGETTGISPLFSISPEGEGTEGFPREGLDGVWYTLDGHRLEGQPAQKGIYIYNGKKTVIK